MNYLTRRLAVVAIVFACACSALAEKRADHVFIISMDGGKPAVLQQSSIPTLKMIESKGASTWIAHTILPSLTLPSHTSMLTGVGPDKHRILWNNWEPGNGVVKVPTVFSMAKPRGYSTAMFVGKEKFRHLLVTNSVDMFDYNVQPGKDTVDATTVAADAATYIIKNKPGLCFIHLNDGDSNGHQYGWGSPEQIKGFSAVDAAINTVIKAVHEAGIDNSSVIIVTADHGGHDKTHGSASTADTTVPWLAYGKGVKKHYSITEPICTCDTTATALWLLDVPIPATLDGKPVTSAFEQEPAKKSFWSRLAFWRK